MSAIERAHASNMGVAVHCTAGKGRTGTILAAWYVTQGSSAQEAVAKVRELRPGSVETEDQELAVGEFARRRENP
jgi:atypical dual specificity phosphatase